MDGGEDGWMDRWMDSLMDRQKNGVIELRSSYGIQREVFFFYKIKV